MSLYNKIVTGGFATLVLLSAATGGIIHNYKNRDFPTNCRFLDNYEDLCLQERYIAGDGIEGAATVPLSRMRDISNTISGLSDIEIAEEAIDFYNGKKFDNNEYQTAIVVADVWNWIFEEKGNIPTRSLEDTVNSNHLLPNEYKPLIEEICGPGSLGCQRGEFVYLSEDAPLFYEPVGYTLVHETFHNLNKITGRWDNDVFLEYGNERIFLTETVGSGFQGQNKEGDIYNYFLWEEVFTEALVVEYYKDRGIEYTSNYPQGGPAHTLIEELDRLGLKIYDSQIVQNKFNNNVTGQLIFIGNKIMPSGTNKEKLQEGYDFLQEIMPQPTIEEIK